MNYNFKEKLLPLNFALEKIEDIRLLIDRSLSFTIVGLPSLGVSLFLKYLSLNTDKIVVYLDTYSISEPNKHGFYLLLGESLGANVTNNMSDQEILQQSKDAVSNLVKKHKKVLIIINRFELLEKEFTQQFLGSLRLLPHEFGNNVSYIFSLTLPFEEIAIESLGGGNLDLFTRYYYFKPYQNKDLIELLKIHNPELNPTPDQLKEALSLSGGHFQLFQLLLKTERGKIDPLRDPFIKFLLKQIYDNFSYEIRRQIQKIALGKKIDVDDYLLRIGLVNEKDEFFSKLFKIYVLSQISLKLPAKEAMLFGLLKNAKGKVVSKEKIFQEIWKNSDNASDWALDSLIYRLRRNPIFKRSGYVLESYKKQGYVLSKF
ncbi:MAG TPA: helix-turn-helix domain-containing protein [Patescibacteria group bacterium]